MRLDQLRKFGSKSTGDPSSLEIKRLKICQKNRYCEPSQTCGVQLFYLPGGHKVFCPASRLQRSLICFCCHPFSGQTASTPNQRRCCVRGGVTHLLPEDKIFLSPTLACNICYPVTSSPSWSPHSRCLLRVDVACPPPPLVTQHPLQSWTHSATQYLWHSR